MKKLLIPFVVGLAIGLGLTSVFVGFIAAKPPSLEESLTAAVGADTTAAHAGDELPSDSTAHGGEQLAVADGALNPASGFLPEDVIHIADSISDLSRSSSPSTFGAQAATAGLGGSSMETPQLAKLFGSMQAREAARVLEYMDDYEVQVILNELGNREAAAILSNLSPERAAVISRSVIRGERSVQ